MKIFITGSAGFIGTHLRESLENEGHSVIGLDNLSHPCAYHKKPEIVDSLSNIEDYIDLIANSDWVINLAADINVEKSLLFPFHAVETNFIAAMKLLDICSKLDVKLIHASTSEIYGDRIGVMDENHRTCPKSPYAASKLAIDGMIRAYVESYGTRAIIVRNYNTFGKYQSNDKFGAVIGIFAHRILNDKPPVIFGDGSARRDFMHYSDAIDFYKKILYLQDANTWGEQYNVGTGKSISIDELAKLMIKISGKNLTPIYTAPRPGEVREFLCDNTKARSLGWSPKTDLEALLGEYMDWVKSS